MALHSIPIVLTSVALHGTLSKFSKNAGMVKHDDNKKVKSAAAMKKDENTATKFEKITDPSHVVKSVCKVEGRYGDGPQDANIDEDQLLSDLVIH